MRRGKWVDLPRAPPNYETTNGSKGERKTMTEKLLAFEETGGSARLMGRAIQP